MNKNDSLHGDSFTIWQDIRIFTRHFRSLTGFTRGKGILLHGGEGSSSERTIGFCKWLAHLGFEIASFDFEGQGKSEGSLLGSSLKRRQDLAKHVADELLNGEVDFTLGFSMGGATALDLAANFTSLGISQVFFICAGSYSAKAFDVPFGPEFKKILTTQDSWKDSDVVLKAERFNGAIYVITAENDSVIPDGVTRLLLEAAMSCKGAGYIKIPGSTHKLSTEMFNDDSLAHRCATLVSAIFEINRAGTNLVATDSNGS